MSFQPLRGGWQQRTAASGEISRMMSALVLRWPASRNFDAFVCRLPAAACAEAKADMGEVRILNRLSRTGAVVLAAPVSVLTRLSAMPEVAAVSGDRGQSAFIPPVRVVVEGTGPKTAGAWMAEGVGVEPTGPVGPSGFRDRSIQPLWPPSEGGAARWARRTSLVGRACAVARRAAPCEREPPAGFEPSACRLQDGCSAAELQGRKKDGGPGRDRTGDLPLATRLLSRLSYGPGTTVGPTWSVVRIQACDFLVPARRAARPRYGP